MPPCTPSHPAFDLSATHRAYSNHHHKKDEWAYKLALFFGSALTLTHWSSLKKLHVDLEKRPPPNLLYDSTLQPQTRASPLHLPEERRS